jgi:hypothetical protein
MTENLTERLRKKAVNQTAETEKIVSDELKRLSNAIREQLRDEFLLTQIDIRDHRMIMSADLEALNTFSRRWVLVVAGLLVGLVILVCFLIWLLIQAVRPMDLRSYQTFTENGQVYLIVPEGSVATNCRSSGKAVACIRLPSGEQ